MPERVSFEQQRTIFLSELRSDPGLLANVNLLPAFAEIPLGEDMSASNFLDLYYGITEQGFVFQQECVQQGISRSEAIARRTGKSSGHVLATAPVHLEVLRKISKLESPRLTSETHYHEVVNKMQWLENAILVKDALEWNDRYTSALFQVPVYSGKNIPSVVDQFVEQIWAGEQVNMGDLPNIEKVLRVYYGIGIRRSNYKKLNERFGFSNGSEINLTINAAVLLLRKRLEDLTQEQPTEYLNQEQFTDDLTRVANSLHEAAQIISIYGGNEYLNGPTDPRSIVTVNYWKLKILNYPHKKANKFINSKLKCVNKYNAPPLLGNNAHKLAETKRFKKERSATMSKIDQWEYAAYLLETPGHGIPNVRTELILNIMNSILYSNEEFASRHSVDVSKVEVNNLLRSAINELLEANIIHDPFIKEELLAKLYREYRNSIGGVNVYSSYEKKFLVGIAEGKTLKKIADDENENERIIRLNYLLLIRGGERVNNRREITIDRAQHALSILESNTPHPAIEMEFNDYREFKLILNVLEQRAKGLTVAQLAELMEVSESTIVRWCKRGIAVANNFLSEVTMLDGRGSDNAQGTAS